MQITWRKIHLLLFSSQQYNRRNLSLGKTSWQVCNVKKYFYAIFGQSQRKSYAIPCACELIQYVFRAL